jgi:hypothetical protein
MTRVLLLAAFFSSPDSPSSSLSFTSCFIFFSTSANTASIEIPSKRIEGILVRVL